MKTFIAIVIGVAVWLGSSYYLLPDLETVSSFVEKLGVFVTQMITLALGVSVGRAVYDI